MYRLGCTAELVPDGRPWLMLWQAIDMYSSTFWPGPVGQSLDRKIQLVILIDDGGPHILIWSNQN